VDQLAPSVREFAQLEPPMGAGEERIVLHQVDRTLGREGARPVLHVGKAVDARLDLDIPRRRTDWLRSSPLHLHQVPQVAVEIREHGDGPVGLFPRRPHELHSARRVLAMVAREIVGVEKQEHAPARLVADPRFLLGAHRAREEKTRRRARRRHDDPALALFRDSRISTSSKPRTPT
jgi:hypothetical protein